MTKLVTAIRNAAQRIRTRRRIARLRSELPPYLQQDIGLLPSRFRADELSQDI